jgi:hypothetical protein
MKTRAARPHPHQPATPAPKFHVDLNLQVASPKRPGPTLRHRLKQAKQARPK